MRKGNSGMMLTDVLVTVAILGVLAALLLSNVSRFMRSGESTECISNMRQVGIAIQSYATDNDGALVPNRIQPGSARNYWVGLLAPYLGAKSADSGFSGSQDRTVYMCPTEKTNSTGQSFYSLPVSAGVAYRTRYEINSHITAAYEEDLKASQTYRSGRLSQVKASRTYILMDGFGGGGGGYWIVGSGKLTYPHNGRVNVLYLDNHVESKTAKEMQAYAGSPYHVFWRGYDWGYGGYHED